MRWPQTLLLRLRQQKIANQLLQVVAGGDELTQRANRRSEMVEFGNRHPVDRVSAPEVIEAEQLGDDSGFHRLVDTGRYLDIAGIETLLPFVRRRNDYVAADELAPVVVITKRSREQAHTIT